jgi:xylan 1,4-beta-xylosidase
MPITILPDWSAAAAPFRHTWEGMVNIDQFRWMVRKDCLDHLRQAKAELKATHVRAVGMYCDELRVFGNDPTWFGTKGPHAPRLNWQVVDYIIDELEELGLAPQFTTCFTPSHMASGDMTCFSTKSRTSPPKDYAAWEQLVYDSVAHQVRQRSAATVRNWWFEVWNEPNLSPPFFGGDQREFFKLWECTYRAIKRVDPTLRVGGPSAARNVGSVISLILAGKMAVNPITSLLTVITTTAQARRSRPLTARKRIRKTSVRIFSPE